MQERVGGATVTTALMLGGSIDRQFFMVLWGGKSPVPGITVVSFEVFTHAEKLTF